MAGESYGLDPAQFSRYVIGPALETLGLCSEAAAQLVLGTCMAESRLRFLHQIGDGPALGVAQMEPHTHDDIWKNFLPSRPRLRGALLAMGGGDALKMIGSLDYAVAMCRVHYARVRAPIPAAFDSLSMARYWKQYYNTPLGAGSADEAVRHFHQACSA